MNNIDYLSMLEARAEKFDFDQLKAAPCNPKETYNSFQVANFVVNGEKIDKDFFDGLDKEYENFEGKAELSSEFVKLFFQKMLSIAITPTSRRDILESNSTIPDVLSDSILKELSANCNRFGYLGSLLRDEKFFAEVEHKSTLRFESKPQNDTIYIECDALSKGVKVRVEESISVCDLENQTKELCELKSSLEFALEPESDGFVAHKDGKLSLTVPRELKNYKVGDKNLFDIIKEYFQKFCEMLGFNFSEKIEQDLKGLKFDHEHLNKPRDNLENPDKTPHEGKEHIH